MPVAIPEKRPKLNREQLMQLIAPLQFDASVYPLFIVGIRGYYRNTLGKPRVNDRGIYDDAIFLVSPRVFKSFNANTDPSSYRPQTANRIGIATLMPGVYYCYRFSIHRGKTAYPAICQRVGPVNVTRDGLTKVFTGNFGINIHKGGYNSTSSKGCQTIFPAQWDEFYNLAKSEAENLYAGKWKTKIIPYMLIENTGQI